MHYHDYTVVEAIANSGIAYDMYHYFDVIIFEVDENEKQIGTLYSEKKIPTSCWQVFIPKEYKNLKIVGAYRGSYRDRDFISIDVCLKN